MKAGQLWSTEYGRPVSSAFYNMEEESPIKLKIDITNCTIKISPFGYYYLWYKGKMLRKISFTEYLKYRDFVKKVEDMKDYE